MFKNTAFCGTASTTPVHFHDYDITNLSFYVNGVQHHSFSQLWFPLQSFEQQVFTKNYFQVLIYITMTVPT